MHIHKGKEKEGKKIAKMVLRRTLFAWLCVQAVYGQENPCSVDYTKEGCAKIVIINLKDKVVREKTEFTVSYRTDSGEDIIADCNWLRSGSFSCDPATGYTCDLQSSDKFLVDLSKHKSCTQSGEFLFDVAHEEIFSCKIEPGKNTSDNATANPEREKKCANGTGLARKKRSTDESEDLCQQGASNTGMIIGVACACLLAVAGVSLLVVYRKKLLTFVRKRKPHKGTCIEAQAYKTAVKDFEKSDRSIPETEDSAKTDTLEEKDAVFEALNLRHEINYEEGRTITYITDTEIHHVECNVKLVHCAS